MIEIAVLSTAAIVVRAAGGMVRGAEHGGVVRVGGWVLCAVGLWLLAGAAGAWFPIWPVLLLGAGAGAVHMVARRDQPIMASTDAAVVILCGALSIPALAIEVLIGTAVLAVLMGLMLDQLPRVTPRAIRLAAFGAPLVLGAAGLIVLDRSAAGGDAGAWHRTSPLALLNVGISRSMTAQRVELPTGAVAWLEWPRRTEAGRLPGAVVFHGNHRDGSHQPAATVLRRALLERGFVVLSLDHPGYGATPLPALMDDIDAWDPSPHVRAALMHLRANPHVTTVIANGHSLGCLDVLRALQQGPVAPDAGVVFGMGVFCPPPDDEHWVRRFLAARHLPYSAIDAGTGAAIRHRFYEAEPLLNAGGPSPAPVVFARFGMEHENLVVGREKALRLFHEQPIIWDLDDSTHYFSASERFGIIFGDVRVTRDLARRLGDLPVHPGPRPASEHVSDKR